jgi:class 3 adenylate cyclase
VRIGIATGLVVVGDLIGEGASQEQAVVGETPNLAARFADSGRARDDRRAGGNTPAAQQRVQAARPRPSLLRVM